MVTVRTRRVTGVPGAYHSGLARMGGSTTVPPGRRAQYDRVMTAGDGPVEPHGALPSADTVPVPDILLDGADADALAVAGALAVLRAEATIQRAACVAGLDLDDVERATQRLVDAGVLRPELPPAFAVPATADAVVSRLPLVRRSSLHLAAAECLREDGVGPDVVATHLLGTAARGRAWVVELLREAAGHARRNGDNPTAVALLRRALLEPPAAGDRASLLVDLAIAESAVADPAAIGRLEEALRLLPDGPERVRVRFRLGRTLTYAGAVEQGLAVLGQALDEIGDETSDLAYRIETAFIAAARVDVSSIHLARARLARRREQPPAGATPTERGLLAELAYLEGLDGQRLEVARELALRAVGGRSLAHVAGLEPAARHLALIVLMWTGELELVEQALHLALQLGRQHGSRPEEALAHELLAAIAQERGQVTGVVAEIAACTRALGQGRLVTVPAHRARLAMAHLDRGDVEAAQELVDAYEAEAREHAGSVLLHLFLVARAHVRLAAGDPERALADALECGRGTAQLGNRNPGFPQWRAPAVTALARLGRFDEARRLADEEVALARGWGLPRPLGVALTARARAVPERDRVAVLEEAVEVLRRSPAALDLARALADLGEALRASGREEEARAARAEAQSIAARNGARLTPDDDAVPTPAGSASTPAAPGAGAGAGVDVEVEVSLLDGFALRRCGVPVALHGVPATLVKVLAVTRRPIHVEQVAELLWADGDPASRTRLRNVLARVRRTAGEVVVREGEALRLSRDVRVDAWLFADAASELLRPGPPRGDEWLVEARGAVGLYTGDLLPEDPYAEWAASHRSVLARLHLDLLDAMVATVDALGRPDDALPLVRRAIDAEPLDLRRYHLAARLAEAAGRAHEASQFRARAEKVADELGR
jgi:DNA-binding SARP family transcriptional activator